MKKNINSQCDQPKKINIQLNQHGKIRKILIKYRKKECE